MNHIKTEIYFDYVIEQDFDAPLPFRWSATHKDYDGPGDRRHFRGITRSDVIMQIDDAGPYANNDQTYRGFKIQGVKFWWEGKLDMLTLQANDVGTLLMRIDKFHSNFVHSTLFNAVKANLNGEQEKPIHEWTLDDVQEAIERRKKLIKIISTILDHAPEMRGTDTCEWEQFKSDNEGLIAASPEWEAFRYVDQFCVALFDLLHNYQATKE